MKLDKNWLLISIFGALIYGVFSLLFGILPDEIKKDEMAQLGYGMLIVMFSLPIHLCFLGTINRVSPKSIETLYKYFSWKILAFLCITNVIYNPLHSLIFNAGGTLGHQITYTAAIIPVLLGGYFFLNEKLGIRHWVGILLAGLGTFFMTMKPELAGQKKDPLWLLYAILGSLTYGVFSLLLSMLHPEIKKDMFSQMGFGSLIVVTAFPINMIVFAIWKEKYPDSYDKLKEHVNVIALGVLCFFAALTNPVHAVVINAAGTVGQQVMYSLAIIPVLIGSYFLLNEKLNFTQLSGIGLAGAGTYFMSSAK